jgi:hypothetical protein
VKTHSVPGFVLPVSEKGCAGALDHTPWPCQRPPAELERGANFQISPASAKIVSDFSLETNGYALGFRV